MGHRCDGFHLFGEKLSLSPIGEPSTAVILVSYTISEEASLSMDITMLDRAFEKDTERNRTRFYILIREL